MHPCSLVLSIATAWSAVTTPKRCYIHTDKQQREQCQSSTAGSDSTPEQWRAFRVLSTAPATPVWVTLWRSGPAGTTTVRRLVWQPEQACNNRRPEWRSLWRIRRATVTATEWRAIWWRSGRKHTDSDSEHCTIGRPIRCPAAKALALVSKGSHVQEQGG